MTAALSLFALTARVGAHKTVVSPFTFYAHVKPIIDRRYPLSEVVDALRWVDDGKARGKVVITM